MTDSLAFARSSSPDEGGAPSSDRGALEAELARLIVAELRLEGVRPEEIDPEAPLFDDGLGLDSVDALQLAVVLQRRYGARVADDDGLNRQIFSSLRSLAGYLLGPGRGAK